MPSPVGHVIAGVAAGWLVAGRPKAPDTVGREALLFGALAALPDIDLLVGAHSGPTHSLGAALAVGVLAALLQRTWTGAGLSPGVLAAACGAAYGSHALLDWLGTDTSPPIGIMALWPFTAAHYESDLHVFMAVSRRYYHGWVFVRHNALALVRELVILVPLLMVTILLRPRSGWRQSATP